MSASTNGTKGSGEGSFAQDPTRFEWIVQALFVDADPERLEALARVTSGAAIDWDGFVELLEVHHLLMPVWSNLRAAGVQPPCDLVSRLEAREVELREDARRDRVTLERFLARADARDVRVVLLKGASLDLDLYDDPALRYREDLDVLVDRGQLGAALHAARDAGFVLRDVQFPVWWYRLVHFHLALRPAVSLMKPLEIHWRLHSPALLLTIDPAQLLQRSSEVTVGGYRARTLDPVDRLLHLSTHLVSHWRQLPSLDGKEMIRSVLAASEPPVCLKWVLDLVVATERLAVSAAPEEPARRAREWGAEASLRCALELVAVCPISKRAYDWVRRVGDATAAVRQERGMPVHRRRTARQSDPTTNFRWETLDLLPRWIWPSSNYLRRRYPIPSATPIRIPATWIARGLHAAAVLGRAALAALVFPMALLGRLILRPGRRRRRKAALRPDRIFEVAETWEKTSPTSDRLE